MSTTDSSSLTTLAVGLGANLPSKAGPPNATLCAARPQLETLIKDWLQSIIKKKEIDFSCLRWRWSPLFETDPLGGPED